MFRSWQHFAVVLGFSAVALVGCGGAGSRASVESAAARLAAEREATGPTTVAVLGTLHAAHLRYGYSLGVIEDVVRSFRPDVVLIEVPPAALGAVLDEVDGIVRSPEEHPAGRWVRELPELYAVVLPLRHELGFGLVGVLGMDEAGMAERDAFYLGAPHGPIERAYLVANASLHAAFLGSDGPNNPAWLHGPEFLELSRDATLWLAYYAEEAMGRGGELWVQSRSAALLDEALDGLVGQRVLVVYDVTARWWIEDALDVRGDVVRVDTRALLPGAVIH